MNANGAAPPQPAATPLFFADEHLGGLARLLRLAGFDTRFEPGLDDATIVSIATREGRCVLSRDRELLQRRELRSGRYVHALKPRAQLAEVLGELQLAAQARPFSRCLACNAPLRRATGEEIAERLPPGVREQHARFTRCDGCGRVYWEGSHWRRMQRLLQEALGRHAV